VSAVLGQANRLKVLSVSCKIDRLPEEMGHLAKMGEMNKQMSRKPQGELPDYLIIKTQIHHLLLEPYATLNTMQNLCKSPFNL